MTTTNIIDNPTIPIRLRALMARLGNVGFGAFSRMFALASQFVVLVLLGKVLQKSDFGDFMIVYALCRVLATGLGTGLATLLVFHISRNASERMEYALHRSVALIGLLASGPICVSMMLSAPQIASLFGKPTLTHWIVSMAPFMLFYTLLTISTGAFDGRGRITRSILASEFFPNLIRLLALPPLLLLQYGNTAVAMVMVASVLLPWLVIACRLLGHLDAGFSRLTKWDMQYSGKLTVHSFAAMQMQGIDMLVVGWLFASTAAADYAIASRVAALIPFFQQIIVKSFMAEAGRSIHEQDHGRLQATVDRSRYSAVTLVTLTAVAAMLVYPFFLRMMGNFGGSMPLLAILAGGAVYRSYFPGADALIRVAGHADFSLGVMLTSVGILVGLPLLASSVLGVYAVAVSMTISGAILNPVMERYVRRVVGARLIDGSAALPMLMGLAGTAVAFFAHGHVLVWLAGTALVGASLIPVQIHHRRGGWHIPAAATA